MWGPAADADDALVLVALRTHLSLCTECIATKVSITTFRVDQAAGRLAVEETAGWLGRATRVTTRAARCEACLKDAVVHRLG
jgi:hypothetical protein